MERINNFTLIILGFTQVKGGSKQFNLFSVLETNKEEKAWKL